MNNYVAAALGLLLLLSIETTDPTMSIAYSEVVTPGDTVYFSIRIDNTTAHTCNEGLVSFDLDAADPPVRVHFHPLIPEGPVSPLASMEASDTVVLSVEVYADAPNGQYDIPIVYETTMGTCDGGCFPIAISQVCTVEVKRNLPEMYYEFDRSYDLTAGTTVSLPFYFANRGTGNASNCKISVSGVDGVQVSRDSYSRILPQESYTPAIVIDTAGLDPGFYYLNVNVVYYDDYFKLYTDKLSFLVQVRPPNPLIDVSILQEKRALIIDLANEGGLKAKNIILSLHLDNEYFMAESVDELIPRGELLIPVSLPEDVYGSLLFRASVTYEDTAGTPYFAEREIFINVPKNTGRSLPSPWYALFAGIVVAAGAALVLRRKKWTKND